MPDADPATEPANQEPIPVLRSLQGRLILLVCGLVVGTAIVSVGLVVRESMSALVAQQLREMEQVTGAAVARMGLRSKALESRVEAIARDPVLAAAALEISRGQPDLQSLADIEQILVRHSQFEAQILALSFYAADGRLVRRAGGSNRPRPNSRTQADDGTPRVVAAVLRRSQEASHVVGPVVAENTLGEAHPWLIAAAPLQGTNGQLLGVVYVEHDVQEFVLTMRAEAKQRLAALGADLVFLDAGGGAIGERLAGELAGEVTKIRDWLGATPSRAASEVMDLSPGAFVVAAAGLPETALGSGHYAIIALIAGEDAVAARARSPLLGSLAASAVLLILAAALGIIFARGIFRPLERLLAAVRSFGEGADFQQVHAGNDEVGRLASAFQDMATRVQERNRALGHEVEERQRAEGESRERAQRLEASEARFRQLYESMPAGVVTAAEDGTVRTANPAALSLLGFRSESDLRRASLGADIWIGPGEYLDVLQRVRREGEVANLEIRLRRHDGRICWALASLSAVWGVSGNVVAFEMALVDITERKQAEYSQRASELRFRRLYDSNMMGVAFGSLANGMIQEANPYVLSLIGYEAGELPLSVASLLPGDWADITTRLRQSASLRQPMQAFERNLVRRDGTEVPVLINAAMLDPAREDFVAAIVDRSEAVTAERLNRELKDFFQFVLDSIEVRVAYVDARERIRFFNRAYLEWYGEDADAVRGKSIAEIVDAARYAVFAPHLRGVLAGVPQRFEYQAGSGSDTRSFQTTYQPHVGAGGEVLGFFAVSHEITETRALEARLRQSQKLEAVGQLTGGIAHDFNNLLSVVIGNVQLVERTATDEASRRSLQAALKAAGRGAELTRRLLSFSRRQAQAPQALDLGPQLEGVRDLIGQTLGGSFQIKVQATDDLWPISVDVSELENALLNLAINARDAMPGGGRIDISAENALLDAATVSALDNLESSEVVRVTVRDHGCGMDSGVAARAFEPFFTTKPEGKGSGLGLSMVYGFVRQSAGAVRVRSASGSGTTVEMFFPRSFSKPSLAGTAVAEPLRGNAERVLVVEDDAEVREVTVAMLEGLGYRTLEAADGSAALLQLALHEDIELVLSDIKMPGPMQGHHLAAEIARVYPAVPVLLATGHADLDPAIGRTSASAGLLWKPLNSGDLSLLIRSTLERSRSVPRAEMAGT